MTREEAYVLVGVFCMLVGLAIFRYAPNVLAYSQRRRKRYAWEPRWLRSVRETRAHLDDLGYVPTMRVAGVLTIIFGVIIVYLGLGR